MVYFGAKIERDIEKTKKKDPDNCNRFWYRQFVYNMIRERFKQFYALYSHDDDNELETL